MAEWIKFWMAKYVVDFGVFLGLVLGMGAVWLWMVVSHKLAMRRWRKENIQRGRGGRGENQAVAADAFSAA